MKGESPIEILYENLETKIQLISNTIIIDHCNEIITGDKIICLMDSVFNYVNNIKNNPKLVKKTQSNIKEYIYKPIQAFINEYIKETKKKQDVDENKNSHSIFRNNVSDDLKTFYFKYQKIKDNQKYKNKIMGMNAAIWGYIGVITNGLSAIIQMYTLYKLKSAKSFSMPFIYIMTLLNGIYFIIGIIEQNPGLSIATAFFVIYNFTVIYTYMKYK
jgi:hypothetical protein